MFLMYGAVRDTPAVLAVLLGHRHPRTRTRSGRSVPDDVVVLLQKVELFIHRLARELLPVLDEALRPRSAVSFRPCASSSISRLKSASMGAMSSHSSRSHADGPAACSASLRCLECDSMSRSMTTAQRHQRPWSRCRGRGRSRVLLLLVCHGRHINPA